MCYTVAVGGYAERAYVFEIRVGIIIIVEENRHLRNE